MPPRIVADPPAPAAPADGAEAMLNRLNRKNAADDARMKAAEERTENIAKELGFVEKCIAEIESSIGKMNDGMDRRMGSIENQLGELAFHLAQGRPGILPPPTTAFPARGRAQGTVKPMTSAPAANVLWLILAFIQLAMVEVCLSPRR